MLRGRPALMGALALYLGMAGLGLFWLPWFSGAIPPLTLNIHLRSMQVCAAGDCVAVSLRSSSSGYTLAGWLTLAGTCAFGLLVAFQASRRLRALDVDEALSGKGYLAAVVLLLVTGITGFVLGPEGTLQLAEGQTLTIAATSARLIVLGSHVLGMGVLALAGAAPADADAPATTAPPPTPGLPPAYAYRGGRTPTDAPPPGRTGGTLPPPLGAAALPAMPAHLRGVVAHALRSAELTRAGLDARREDGASRIVLWADVVGAVARRLPPAYDGAVFVDLVSTPGNTVRVLPWTQLTGEPLAGTDDARARALLERVRAHAPAATLDAATLRFLTAGEPALQLPDAAMLAAHDQRIG